MLLRVITVCVLLIGCAAGAGAGQDFPGAEWRDSPNPIASPEAQIGGELSVFAGQFPKSLNYYLDSTVSSATVFGFLFESLLGTHPISLAYEPALAARWSIGADKQTFTFHIDPKARWSDGQPVTAHDVKWSYDAIMDPQNLTGPHKVALERFETPVVIDSQTICFKAKEVHWRNLGAVGGFQVLPRHVFGKRDFNKINFAFPVVSGPYRIGTISEGLFITLERRENWWRWPMPSSQHTGNFQTLKFRYFAERENAFEAFKKGLIDLYPVYTARLWINETRGERVLNNWIVKQKVFNSNPIGFQGFAMNMRRPPFDDLRVRKAMAHLVNRPKMNSTLMYSQYFLHRSYYEDLYSANHPNPNELIEFDQERARELLQEAGWQVNPATGLREKNGQPFTFKFLTRAASSAKFLAIFAEDLKNLGIRLEIDQKDWAAWVKDMDEFNYQMTWAAWGAGVFKDPEGMWSSKEADRKGGSNITGFKDAKVDALIERQKAIFDVQARNVIYREIDQIVYKMFPYVLLWNINYTRLLYWNKFGMPATILSKYGDESSSHAYWWMDPDTAADLTTAMQAKLPLPTRPASVYFEQVFATPLPQDRLLSRYPR